MFSLTLFVLLYIAIEGTILSYLSSFAVDSKLQLSRIEGTQLTVLFNAAFVAMRFTAVFAAAK